jgi:hypothetical protein
VSPVAHVTFDLHPSHPHAVTAAVTGPQAEDVRTVLAATGWHTVQTSHGPVLVLARIAQDEDAQVESLAQDLRLRDVTTEITTRLSRTRNARADAHVVGPDAQALYDDIRSGHLQILAHAGDGAATTAIGTYATGSTSVLLQGQDHLRRITATFDSPLQALDQALATAEFKNDMRPGRAPATAAEEALEQARTSIGGPPAAGQHQRPQEVPAHAAGPGDHDALLDTWLDRNRNRGWERYRLWPDEFTHAIHESQMLRIERVHEASPRDDGWRVAGYETPVSQRDWFLTLSGAAPAPVVQSLLDALAENPQVTAVGSPLSASTVTEAAQPLTDANWMHTVHNSSIYWETHDAGHSVGLRFDANDLGGAWTLWAGDHINQPLWTLRASRHTPAHLLAALTTTLADGTRTRHQHPHHRPTPPAPTSAPPAAHHR